MFFSLKQRTGVPICQGKWGSMVVDLKVFIVLLWVLDEGTKENFQDMIPLDGLQT